MDASVITVSGVEMINWDIQAAVQRPRSVHPKRIVAHDPGQANVLQGVSAVGVANFNATPPEQRNPPGVGGYHVLVDHGNFVTSAVDANRVNGVTSNNEDTLHICFCDYSDEALRAGAGQVKAWCASWGIPEVRTGESNYQSPGIIGHVDIERAIKDPAGHVDPRQFPWDTFMGYVVGMEVPEGTVMFVGIISTPKGDGYWVVKNDGAVYSYGKAKYYGGANVVPHEHDDGYDIRKLVAPITSAAAAPDGKGYWLVGGDGGVFAFGSAKFLGRPT